MKSKEEILAKKLDDLLADSRIEPYLVGRYFAQSATLDVYDNFEEMVESARDEKQNRIEWIKDIIIGEKDMTTTFEAKCKILRDLFLYYSDEPDWFDWILENGIYMSLAHCYRDGFVELLSQSGEQAINDTFQEMLDFVGIADSGFDSVNDIYNEASEDRFQQVEED
jgi:hypothetical protein